MVAQIDRDYIRARPGKVISRLISYALFEGRPVTTRGQWINPLVFAHFALEKRLPQLRRIRKPVFIIGTGRSGTTVLGIILSMHRDLAYLNEPKALWHAIYPQEDVIGSYDCGPAYYRLDEAQSTPSVVRNAHKLYGAYLAAVLTPRVVDKYPEMVFRVPFVKKIFPDAKFVFLVRNGWDTCASIEKWSDRLGTSHGDEIHDWWGVNQRKWHLMLEQLVVPDPYFAAVTDCVHSLDRHTDMAAVEWIVTMREGLRQIERYGDSVYQLRYEDLVADPVAQLQALLAYCELRDDGVFMAYAQKKLHPAPAHAPFDLHPRIRPLFDETMAALGY